MPERIGELSRLRAALNSYGGYAGCEKEPAREAAFKLGKDLALNVHRAWRDRGPNQQGIIDVIDMFSGAGGMSAGFRAVSSQLPAYRLIAAIDIDPIANATYESNLDVRPTLADVDRLSSDSVMLHELLETAGHDRRAAPLVLIGCAPCQGFSSHRNGAGASDERNSLFLAFASIAVALRADAVVVENVPELLTDAHWPNVERARAMLEENGYYVYLGIHNMAEFGVPQERFRAVMLAMRHPFKPIRGFLPRARFRTVRRAIGALPKVAAGERIRSDAMHHTANHSESTIRVIKAVPRDGGSRPASVGPQCLRRIEERQGRSGYDDVYGRLYWDKPSITITAYSRNPASGRFVHPEQDRGLSAREAALLQGFPRSFWFAGSFDERFRQIGNAVPPTFSSFLASYLLGELLGPRISPKLHDVGVTRPVGRSFSRLIPALKSAKGDAMDELRRRLES